MATIIPFAPKGSIFDPEDIRAMSMALEDVCKALNLSADAAAAREIVAARIVALATRGDRNATILRNLILEHAAGLSGRSIDRRSWSGP
jgi:hypothetical protein